MLFDKFLFTSPNVKHGQFYANKDTIFISKEDFQLNNTPRPKFEKKSNWCPCTSSDEYLSHFEIQEQQLFLDQQYNMQSQLAKFPRNQVSIASQDTIETYSNLNPGLNNDDKVSQNEIHSSNRSVFAKESAKHEANMKTRTIQEDPYVKKLKSFGVYQRNSDQFIPCTYLKSFKPCDEIMFYFHANGEDLNIINRQLQQLRQHLQINIVAIEYPSFGIYEKTGNIAAQIQKDALTVYDFFINKIGFRQSNSIVVGRSMGTGPACVIAQTRQPKLQILISPFTSLKKAVSEVAGSLVSCFVQDRFNNYDKIDSIYCPTLFIHGKRDEVIPFNHSEKLYQKSKNSLNQLVLKEYMSHSQYDLINDIINPIKQFNQRVTNVFTPRQHLNTTPANRTVMTQV